MSTGYAVGVAVALVVSGVLGFLLLGPLGAVLLGVVGVVVFAVTVGEIGETDPPDDPTLRPGERDAESEAEQTER
ncbi:hypothetical protein [Halarchaeum sp. P4]|uniref:hypothetical protein n=1 Tax=Halarchaeum sp. P4 TaxID=3421639 RepID=UPI003EB89CE7